MFFGIIIIEKVYFESFVKISLYWDDLNKDILKIGVNLIGYFCGDVMVVWE